MNEIVLIGDVVKSRNSFDSALWDEFHTTINSLNIAFKNSIKIPFTIYSGDSFGATFIDIASAIKVTLALSETAIQYEFRIVINEGEVNYGLESNNFLVLEGPALWQSGKQMKNLKKSGNYIAVNLKNETLSLVISTILNFILTIKYNWSIKQKLIYQGFKKNKKQKDIAKQYKLSQQYISKIIKQSKFKLIIESEKNLNEILNGINQLIYNSK